MRKYILLLLILILSSCYFLDMRKGYLTEEEFEKLSFPDYVVIQGHIDPELEIRVDVKKYALMNSKTCGSFNENFDGLYPASESLDDYLQPEINEDKYYIKTPYLKDKWWQLCKWYPIKFNIRIYHVNNNVRDRICNVDYYLYYPDHEEEDVVIPLNKRMIYDCGLDKKDNRWKTCKIINRKKEGSYYYNNFGRETMLLNIDIYFDKNIQIDI